jgi:hypothetical protein
MHIQRMADRQQRGIENAGIGTTLIDPNIDFAKLAQSMGWYAEEPISDPKDACVGSSAGSPTRALETVTLSLEPSCIL